MSFQTLRVALAISVASSPRFANWRTAAISLVLTPLIATLMIVAVAASIGGSDLLLTAYASIVLRAFASVLGATNASLAYERLTGVVPASLVPRFGTPAHWLAKVVPPLASAALVALFSIAAVMAIDPAHDGETATRALLALPVALAGGAVVGLAVAVISLLTSDPYIVANVLLGILPLSAGVVAPIDAYPAWLRPIAQLLPMTWTVDAMRTDLSRLTLEPVVLLPWVAAGLVAVGLAKSRLRDGRDTEFI